MWNAAFNQAGADSKIMSVSEKKSNLLRTIPNSNLGVRKQDVLRIHKENMQMVTKLAKMKVKQDILVPIDKSKAFIFNGIDLT